MIKKDIEQTKKIKKHKVNPSTLSPEELDEVTGGSENRISIPNVDFENVNYEFNLPKDD